MDDETIAKIKSLATEALLTDGSHHKQWFLEQILIAIGVDLTQLRADLLKSDYNWEDGVAP